MTAAATSPLPISDTRGAWRRFFAFVRRPELPERAAGFSADGLAVLAKLYVLDLVVMLALMSLLSLATRLGVSLPGHMLEQLKLSPVLLGFIAIAAPIAEELFFRGWQSGRPGHVGAWLIGAPSAGIAVALIFRGHTPAYALGALGVLVAGLGVAAWWLWHCRGRPAMPWFRRHFVWFYFGAAAAFAAVHLTNFTGGISVAMLPLVMPQFIVGLMLGYVRVRFGMWADVLLHIAHNSLFVLVLLAGAS